MSFTVNMTGRTTKSVWLLLLFTLPFVHSYAQKYFFDSYDVRQGLSENKVYDLVQDSKDYIWLGTANGASRFDGRKFENFSSRNGLAPGGVKSLAADKSGNVWLGHLNGGVSFFNGNTFEQVTFDSLTLAGDITSITIIGDSLIWFTSISDGAVRVNLPVRDIRHVSGKVFKGKDGLSDQVSGSAVNREGELICIIDNGMRKFNFEEQRFENYRMPHMTTYFNPTCLYNDSRGNLWFGTHNGGIYKYILSDSRMEMIDLIKSGMRSNWVSCINEDSRGRIWVGTWGSGIAMFEGDKVTIYDQSNGLNSEKIYKIIEDVEGNILIADQVNGLTIFKGDAFTTFSGEEILPDPNVYAIFQDKSGAAWFGTEKGISRYIPWSGKKAEIYNNKSDLIFEEIRFFREDLEGNLWIGANSGGVIKYNFKNQRFESQPDINKKLYTGGQVTAMEIDRQNNLWIGTLEGVAVGTIGEDNFERHTLIDSLTIYRINSIYCDPSGDVWIGTNPTPDKPGLIRYAASEKDFIPVNALKGVIPKSMVMDRSGILYIGTGEGLIAFRNDSVLFRLTTDQGLISDNINLILEGPDGSIYIGTNEGLNRYFPETKRIYSYTERNGFTGIEAKPGAFHVTKTGEIWFGTASGAIQLDPEKLYSKGLAPLTHILSMQVNYDVRRMEPGLRFSFKERTILFDYSSICLTNPDVVRYKVKLTGADEDWRPATDKTREVFSGLRPGKYTFNVIATNSEGLWNSEPASFSFQIRPPFYFTWWFILIVLVVVVLLVIAYIDIREANLKREKVILEEKVRERTAEVVQKSLIIEEKNNDITASLRYAERIQRAMLPHEEEFNNTFALYMPKDIVSGDFYWIYDNGDSLFIAVVDCTGHGVPGAFMSIIGHNSLNKIVREYGLTRPSAILDQLNVEVNKAILLSQEKGIKDGMDLSLIAFHRKNCTLELAGAFNPLYQVRMGEVMVHKTDRFPIGMITFERKKSFTNFTIDIQPGDMLYMSTDGYSDQFGYLDLKKYKTVNLKKLLSRISELPVEEQKRILEKEILEWKGTVPQVDDILVVGMRVPGCQ